MLLDISTNQKPYFTGATGSQKDKWTISLTRSGTGKRLINYGEKVIPLFPGVVVCTPPRTIQQSVSEDGMIDYVIYTTSFPFAFEKQEREVLVFQDDSMGTGEALFQALHCIHWQRSIFLESFMEDLFRNLVNFLENRYIQCNFDPRVARITAHFNAWFNETNLSVDHILASEDESTDHLRRLFKAAHGCTPIQYVTRKRIERAKRMLEGNCLHHHSMSEIAYMSGFSDVSYFARVFKKETSYTPTQYEEMFPG